jgi:3-oxoacyl-[acyl-carrier protein] reductase
MKPLPSPMPDIPRTAVITGGLGTLAQALNLLLVQAGWTVLAAGRDELDVTQSSSVQHYFSQRGPVDLLINNAGLTDDSLVLHMSEAQWQRVMEVNLSGAFRCTRAALEKMVEQRSGHIINISSYSALLGPVGQANYAAAKAGLIALTQSTAQEYGSYGIRCNCVLPGFLETRMTQQVTAPRCAEILASHRLGRFNTVEQAARFIAALDGYEHVSGQVFQLDSRAAG